MISKIPTQPFPFFNTIIRPAWRMMNTLIILIAFFNPWFASYEVITICTSTAGIVAVPDVATVTNKPVAVTVKDSNNMPQAGVPVYACNSQNIIISRRTDMYGQAIFHLSPGSYRFAGHLSTAKNVVKTYNGFEGTGLVATVGVRYFGPYFLLPFIGLLGLLGGSWVGAVAIFTKYPRRPAFIPKVSEVSGVACVILFVFAAVIIIYLRQVPTLEAVAIYVGGGMIISTCLFFIGLLCIGVYALVSPVAIFSKYARLIAFIPLVIGIISMVMIDTFFMHSPSGGWGLFDFGGYRYTWIGFGGYWFTWAGLVSSAVIEFIEWVLIRSRPKKR